MVTKSELTRVADNIRILSAAMVEKAKSGHPGGAMGGATVAPINGSSLVSVTTPEIDFFHSAVFLKRQYFPLPTHKLPVHTNKYKKEFLKKTDFPLCTFLSLLILHS